MKNKDLISYSELGGDMAFTYGKIDKFLGLSRRFSPRMHMLKKAAGTGISAALAVLFGVLMFRSSVPLNILMAVGIVFALSFAKYFFLEYRGEDDTDKVRADRIINADGLEMVYGDLRDASPLGMSMAYLGERFIFVKGRSMYRITDVKKVFLRVEQGHEDTPTRYIASIYGKDESGIFTCDIQVLQASNEHSAEGQIYGLRTPIEEARERMENDTKMIEDKSNGQRLIE